jgi:hypothetical protein
MRKLVLPPKKCVFCGKEMRREDYKRVYDFKEAKYCSNKCWTDKNTGEKHWHWRGDIKKRPDGYLVKVRTGKFIHRMVLEKSLGRSLSRHEQVHHITGINHDNRLENLVLTVNGEHRRHYHNNAPRDEKGRFK